KGQKEAILSEFPNVGQRVFLLSEVVEGVAYDIPDPLGSEEDPPEVIIARLPAATKVFTAETAEFAPSRCCAEKTQEKLCALRACPEPAEGCSPEGHRDDVR
ncbi:MAG: hypothetical protein Q8M58_15180, partial [Anaerolineales bacterium]|nr:hypothetical protein [Anaerolineales bacterium]